jgi:hypothetical protein
MTGALYLDQQVDKHCWNLYDSYGEICVKCNCCGGFDKDSMYTSRLRTVRRWLKEWQPKLTDPGFQTAIQQKNIRTGIRRFQRQIRYYERKVKS